MLWPFDFFVLVVVPVCGIVGLPLGGALLRAHHVPYGSATATPFSTAAIRTASCTCSFVPPRSRTAFSCERTHVSHPVIADAARHASSKSSLSMPGLPI